MPASNSNLHHAKKAKNDEFYTLASDIEKELVHYRDQGHFKGKSVLLNCDDPTESEFWRYFHLNFEFFGLRKLVSTHYDPTEPTYKLEYEGGNDVDYEVGKKTRLRQNGDFRSEECLQLLDDCDMVVTNPPFSLAREFVATLVNHGKEFIIIGDLNWITYKEIFPLLRDDKMWLGYTHIKQFRQPDGTMKKFGNKLWYTNLDIRKRHERLDLFQHYSPREYPKYDNYDAIEVNRVANIPMDYVQSWFVTKDEWGRLAEDKDENGACLWEQARPAIMNEDWSSELPLTDEHGYDTEGGVHGFFVLPSKASPLRSLMRDEDGDGKVWERLNDIITPADIERERERNQSSCVGGATGQWESQSLSWMPSAQDSSDSSVLTRQKGQDSPKDSSMGGQGSSVLSMESESSSVSSSERYSNGKMGVPITFMDEASTEQFDVVGADTSLASPEPLPDGRTGTGRFYLKDEPDVEREREESASPVLEDCHQDEGMSGTVTEGLVFQSRSLTSTTRDSSPLSGLTVTSVITRGTVTGSPSMGRRRTLVSSLSRYCNGVMGVPITFMDAFNPDQFEIVAFRKGADGRDLVYSREREREREYNRTCGFLSDEYSRRDKERRGSNHEKREEKHHVRESDGAEDHPCLMPSTPIPGLMNNPKDTAIRGKSRYARVTIRRRLMRA